MITKGKLRVSSNEPRNGYKGLVEACRELIEVCSYIRDMGNDDDSNIINAINKGHKALAAAEVKP